MDWFNTTSNQWVPLPGPFTVDTANHTIMAQTTHFTLFGVFLGPSSTLPVPAVVWSDPADIVYGTPLTAAQLDATAGVPGTFDYQPWAGAVLGAGDGQLLTADFTPADTSANNVTTAATTLNVKPAPLVITPDNRRMVYGGPIPEFNVSTQGYAGWSTAIRPAWL